MTTPATVSNAQRDRFTGALLGTLVGDALGAPLEGSESVWINRTLNSLPDLAPHEQDLAAETYGPVTGQPVPPGSAAFTDDTQMTVGVAESLLAFPAFDSAHLASRFAANFEPYRGYGPGAFALLTALKNGAPWEGVARRLFGGEGSFGNGAAMRVAPVGVLFYDNPTALRRVARAQAQITHTHPFGVDGAVWQAAAVATALQFDPNTDDFDPHTFLEAVLELSGPLSTPYRDAAQTIHRLLDDPPLVEEIGDYLGNGAEAHRSVPAALYAFLAHWDSFAEAVLFSVRIGGDTDTIAAMTGAIAGALHGADAIPPNWLDAVENSAQGRDYLTQLAHRLFDAWRQTTAV